MTPLIVTGCQRSGTGYISVVLSAAGHWCGHERHYRIETTEPPGSTTVEASHMALPLLDAGDTVVWQTRHPLAVAGSMMARGTIRPRKPAKLPPSGRWAIRLLPQILDEPTHVERCLRYWHDWNRLVEERADLHWRVEDVTVEQIARALALSGRQPAPWALRRALVLVPRNANATPHGRVVWGDVPDGPAKRDARALATEVGYP